MALSLDGQFFHALLHYVDIFNHFSFSPVKLLHYEASYLAEVRPTPSECVIRFINIRLPISFNYFEVREIVREDPMLAQVSMLLQVFLLDLGLRTLACFVLKGVCDFFK